MPDIVFFGRKWDQCSDMLPLSMLSPIIVYIGALTPLAVETYLPKDPECYTRPGHGHYRVAINLIFGIAWLQLLLEVLTFFAALIGTPLETRKRWLAEWLLLGTYINNVVQLGATIFGTWVRFNYSAIPCPEDHALKPLIAVSWVLLALSLLYFVLCLQWITSHQEGIEIWVNRLRFLCSVCACLGFASALEPLRKMDMDDQEGKENSERETALVEHLAETFHIIFGDLDFTTSDRHVGIVLATALQQKRRHVHIKQCLLEGKSAKAGDKEMEEPAKTGSALEHCVTKKYPTLICPSGYAQKIAPNLSAQEAADRYTGFSDRVAQDDLEEALGYFEYAVAAYYVEDQGTVATEKGKQEGKEEAQETEGTTKADPGALHDKPFGDAPPPINENLSNEPAPTFNECPNPASDSMVANGASSPDPSEINRDLYTLKENDSILQSIAENERTSLDVSNTLTSIREAGPEDEKDSEIQANLGSTNCSNVSNDTLSSSGFSVVTPPWVEGVSRNPHRTGEDKKRPTAGRSQSPVRNRTGESKETDSAGNVITRIDIGEDVDRRKSLSGRVVDKAHELGQKIKDSVTKSGETQRSSIEMTGHTVERSKGQKAKDKMDGMNKTAAKAMRGEMQKGGEHSAAASKPEEDDKVTSSYCCFCQTETSTATPLDKLDCIYSRAHNTILGTLPYMIALDWERRTVVLGVRGTSSMSDALTDAIAQPIPILPWLGVVITEPNGGIASVHSGILASAAALNHDLEDHGILNALFSGAAVNEEAKEEHTKDVASQLDDKLVALLAETPAAAAFVDTHAIQSIPVTDIPTVSIEATESDFLQAESTVVSKADSIPESSGNFLNPEPKPASGLTINPESSSNNPSPGSTFRGPSSKNLGSQNSYASTAERSNKGPNPFQDAQYDNSGRSVSPFGEHALSPFSNDAQRATSMRRSSEASHSSHMAPAPSSAMRMQSMMTSKEMKALDEEIIANAINAKKAALKRNQDAYDLAKLSRHTHSKKNLHKPAEMRNAHSTHPPKERRKSLFRFGSMQKAMSHQFPDQSKGTLGQADGAPIDESQPVGEERDPQGNFPRANVERARSSMLQDAGRAMRRMYEDTRASFDIGGHGASHPRDYSPSRAEKQKLPRVERQKSVQAKRANSKRVRFEQQEMKEGLKRASREERRRKQQEAKLRKMQEARQKKIEETLKKAEAQMKGTFVAKIFKSQEDLRKLDSLGLAQEQAKKRADFRLKQLKQLEERKLDCRGWQLVLTGHSLGAGVAALLALKLRPRMPNVSIKCWAFCPPGGLVTQGLSAAMEPFCTSVIVGKDAVPRASLGNLSRLVDEVVVGLARGKCCKARILLRNLTARGRAKCRRPSEYFPVEEIPEQCQEVLDLYTEGVLKRVEAIGQATFPPGRIIYCRRLKETNTESAYDSVWVAPQDVMKEGFIISSKMLKDHLCDSVTAALELSIESLKGKNPKNSFQREAGRRIEAPDSSDEESEGE